MLHAVLPAQLHFSLRPCSLCSPGQAAQVLFYVLAVQTGAALTSARGRGTPSCFAVEVCGGHRLGAGKATPAQHQHVCQIAACVAFGFESIIDCAYLDELVECRPLVDWWPLPQAARVRRYL